MEASKLTASLYRNILRSIRSIRVANAVDEQEFQERERKQVQNDNSDPRLSISLLPAVNRSDELRSRADYYRTYARENFAQESDCLDATNVRNLQRFVVLLRRGEEHRKWLLSDMQFPDPVVSEHFLGQVNEFEECVNQLLKLETAKTQKEDPSDDGWSSEDEDDLAPGLPSWYKNPRSQ